MTVQCSQLTVWKLCCAFFPYPLRFTASLLLTSLVFCLSVCVCMCYAYVKDVTHMNSEDSFQPVPVLFWFYEKLIWCLFYVQNAAKGTIRNRVFDPLWYMWGFSKAHAQCRYQKHFLGRLMVACNMWVQFVITWSFSEVVLICTVCWPCGSSTMGYVWLWTAIQ